MKNNDILRRLRYTFDIDDNKMVSLFAEGGKKVDRNTVGNWLKKEDDKGFVSLYDIDLAIFLNGFIIDKRGKKDDQIPVPEKTLSNNLILRKLKIALILRDDDMLSILKKADFRLGKHELSAFFRKPTQGQYRLCKDQVLRNFLMGLQLTYRPS